MICDPSRVPAIHRGRRREAWCGARPIWKVRKMH